MIAAKSRASMRICTDSPEPSLLDNAIITKCSSAGLFYVLSVFALFLDQLTILVILKIIPGYERGENLPIN